MQRDGLTPATPGTLQALTSVERNIVFLIRMCETMNVPFCKGVYDRQLAKDIFHSCDIGTQDFQNLGIEVRPTARLALLTAAARAGGRDHDSASGTSLLVADFPKASTEDFDAYKPEKELKCTGKPPKSRVATVDEWRKHGVRFARWWAAFYGAPYLRVIKYTVECLPDRSENLPAVYPFWNVTS